MSFYLKKVGLILGIAGAFLHFSCGGTSIKKPTMQDNSVAKLDTITFGAGCFCVLKRYTNGSKE